MTTRPDPARVHLAIDWRALPIAAFVVPCTACGCVPGDLARHNLHASAGERSYHGRVRLATVLDAPRGWRRAA